MLLISILLALAMPVAVQEHVSAKLVADTLQIEPLGVRFTVPPLWMGRIPGGGWESARDSGRFGCQMLISGAVEDRIVTAPEALEQITRGIFDPVRSYQTALDSIFIGARMVAHVGGDRFSGGCVAPQIHLYVSDTSSFEPSSIGDAAQRIVGRKYSKIHRTESDSSSWYIVRLNWTDAATDWIKPATFEIWTRRSGTNVLILGVMDRWSGRLDANAFLSSFR